MPKVVLTKAWDGHAPGAIVDVSSAVASRLVLRRMGYVVKSKKALSEMPTGNLPVHEQIQVAVTKLIELIEPWPFESTESDESRAAADALYELGPLIFETDAEDEQEDTEDETQVEVVASDQLTIAITREDLDDPGLDVAGRILDALLAHFPDHPRLIAEKQYREDLLASGGSASATLQPTDAQPPYEATPSGEAEPGEPVIEPAAAEPVTPTALVIPGVDKSAIDIYVANSLDTIEKLDAATDKELEALPGIGKATVKRTREGIAKLRAQ